MIDFSVNIYRKLLETLKAQNSEFYTFDAFSDRSENLSLCLRHDVDLLPQNSLTFARIQTEMDIHGTYYFRIVPESFQPKIIEKIAKLGHEIGYHYEDIDLAYKARKEKDKRQKIKVEDLLEDAIGLFEKNLKELRKYYPVKTICMHGSPLSPFDNKALWSKYDYRNFGIIGEPYFDIDFNEVAYYTDTGRKWDGEDVSVRDKVSSKKYGVRKKNNSQPTTYNLQPNFPRYHGTQDIINAISEGTFPKKAMLTFHPQRWTNNPFLWTKELLLQNAKNVVKKYMYVKK